MTTRRTGHSATVLQDDTVLISGGEQANGFIPVYLRSARAFYALDDEECPADEEP
ncbi:MAG: hypothetical protein DMG61_17485 [Acidobacteria bacterium]|nr:MAG: hypothetical protein DMG61_17485 [Acidobacteriota bacterium]